MARPLLLANAEGMVDADEPPLEPGPGVAGVLTLAEYQSLANFRFHVSRFFASSEAALEAAGLSPKKYHAMLAIKAGGSGDAITMTELADRLFIRLNSAVELVGRMEVRKLVYRRRAAADGRRIEIGLTERGEELLECLAKPHLDMHRKHLPELVRLLKTMAAPSARNTATSASQ